MTTRQTGAEPFHSSGRPSELTVLDFWQWSRNLLDNTHRGLVAEYLVSAALGVADGVRTEWDACDVRLVDGSTIEVKSAGYVQSWAQNAPSKIVFDIAPKHGWDATTNTIAEEKARGAEVYVFCLLAERDRETVDPLDLEQWRFYVVPTYLLDERLGPQKTMALSTLESLGPIQTAWDGLAAAVHRQLDAHRESTSGE